MKSDGSTIIASQAVTSGTATLVIPHTTADITGSKSFHVIALGNNLGTDSAASVSQPFMVPMVPVSTDTNVALKMLSKIQGPPAPDMYSRGVAVNRTTGNIYVLDYNSHRILAFNRTGNFMFKIGTETAGTANGQFNYPYGIAVDTFGNIYVADTSNHRIQIFDSTGRFMFKFGTSGTANGQFNSPHGIAVDTAGNIYVADLGNHRVQAFDSVGTFLFKIGNATNAAGSANGEFNNPCGIAIDPENNIIVTEITNHRIQVFNSTGTFMCKFGSLGAGTANLNGPQGVAVDNTGKILVSDTDNGRIQVLSRTGNTISYVRTISSFGTNDSQLSSNRGIAVNADNDIIVANPNSGNVKIFKNDGTFLFKIAGSVLLGDNGGVAIDILNDTIWAVDSTANAIKKFTSTGMLVSQFGTNGTGNGQFNGPTGIAVHMQTGNICVADANNHRIQVFGSAGNHIRSFGSVGSGDGKFQVPRGIATDSAGNIYVADTGNNRIQKFNSQGEFVSKFGSLGSATGEFVSPHGIAVDAVGNIYVADTTNHRIQKFNSQGQFVSMFGSQGIANGQFKFPSGIAIDIAGNIIVDDRDNNRIQIFTSAGMHIRSFGSNGTGNGQFAYSAGLALNASGHIVVADSQNYRIQIIGPTPDLELDANNGVTVKFIGNSSTVLSTAPKFVYANPRGTGSEWFAVVDNSANAKTMIRNYANYFSNPAALAMSTGDYFTNGANGLVAFNNIVTTLMTDMSNLFNPDGFTSPNASGFNQPIASWDTSNVTTFLSMFEGATAFNQPIGSWDTSKVTQMSNMFYNASTFNHYIGSWNTINVYGMSGTFRGASAFNKPIGLWNTMNVVNMNSMFAYTTNFNQPIGSWNTINVGNMDSMFALALAFNKDISKWNVANLTRNPPLNFNVGGFISIANLPTWAPELSNFTVGTKSLGDVAFAITAPTSTVATTYATNAVKPTILFNGIVNTDTGYVSTANGAISGDGTIIAVMSSIAPSGATLKIYNYNSTPSTYVMNTMTLNGTTNGIQLSNIAASNVVGNAIGLVSGKKGTISMWWNFTAASSGSQVLWVSRNNSSNGDIVSLIRLSNGSIYFKAGNATTNAIVATTSSNAVCASAGMYHIFVSWDTSVANRVNILINGVQQTLTMGGFILDSTIAYGAENHGIGGNLYNPFSPTTPGMVGQVYVNYVEYVDPSNIGKFYGGANTPVGLGENGNVPTGSIPTFYIEYSPVCSLVNLGSSLIRFGSYGSLIAGTTYNGTGAGFGSWSQLGGNIVGTNLLGMVRRNDPSCISMSANGKLICLSQEYNQMTILKFDDTKTIAPAKWIVSQLTSSLSGFGYNVVLSGDGNTLVIWSSGASQVFSTTDGGTTWSQKGQNLNGTFVSTSISANGLTIVAFVSNAPTVYTWYYSSWVASTPIGSGNLVAISGDGKIINVKDGRIIKRYSLNAGAWTYVGASGSYSEFDGSWHMSTSFDGSLITVTCMSNSGELRLFRWNGSSIVSLMDQQAISNRTSGNASNYYPFAATLSYTGRFVIGGVGQIGVYDIISNGAITYTNSNPSVADLYGNAMFMKAVGTSTITASQTSASGTGTITSTLTVIPQFAAPVLSSKVHAFTATPGSYTFTATCTVDAAVAQVKIIKPGTADTILSVSGGSVSISMSYATADISTSFYVVAVGNATGGTSNHTSQVFFDPPPVLSNFTVGTKALGDIGDNAFVLTEPASTMQISYTSNSITPVGQSFTGLTTAAWNIANLVKISADGTTIGIVIGTSTGTVRMYKLISNVWTQWGGDITGTAGGLYAGVLRFDGMGSSPFSMSADGTLLTIVQSGLGGFAGLLNVYKYDVNKTTAQTTNPALPTYGPINWSRVATMQLLTTTPNVVLSADGQTMAVSDGTLRMYRSSDGGTTWTPRGETITDTDPLYNRGFFHSIGISANGFTVVAAPTSNQGNAAKYMCYEWNGATWDASFIRNFNHSDYANSCAISADGKVCIINSSRYTKNASSVWTLAHNFNVSDVYHINTSADGNFISFGRPGNNPTHGDVEIHRWNGSAYVAVINNRTIQNRTTDFMQFNAMLSSDGTRIVVGGKGKVDVYDLVATGKTSYASSDPAVAEVHGRITLMKAGGTSTITASQTNGAGSGTITAPLTVALIPQFAAPVLSNKVFAFTATPGSYTFTATCTVDAAVAQIKIMKSGTADTIISVSGGSVSISVSYATADLYTSFYVVALTNGLIGSQNSVLQVFFDPPPVLSNFVVGTKFLADSTFVLTEPTSTTSFAYTLNSVTRVGQAFTGIPVVTADRSYAFAAHCMISQDGKRMVHVIPSSSGTFKIFELQSGLWGQVGGDIVGTGAWSGINGYGEESLSISADGTIVAFGASNLTTNALYANSGEVSIYQYDSSKTTAQLSNGALATYGPAGWNRIGRIQSTEQIGIRVSLSANGKTIAFSGPNYIKVYSYGGGTTWNQMGSTISGTQYGMRSLKMSANGFSLVQLGHDASTKMTFHEWNGSNWIESIILNDINIGAKATMSYDGKTIVINNDINNSYMRTYTRDSSTGVWSQINAFAPWLGTVKNLMLSSNGKVLISANSPSNSNQMKVQLYAWSGTGWNSINNSLSYGINDAGYFAASASINSDGTRFTWSKFGIIDIYDLNTTSKTAYTSSDTAVASVYGNLVLMNSVGTSTITATQTNGSGSGTISSTLTVVAWTLRNAIAGYSFRSVAYGNGTWVAVAPSGVGNNKVMTSIDGGVNWTSVSVSGSPMSVAYGNGSNGDVFVAVGTFGLLWTSPDGLVWTSRTGIGNHDWSSVAYGNGLWVAVATYVGYGDRVMTSHNSVNWTGRTAAADNSWVSVAYGNGLWVAVANNGTGNRVMTSPDGSTWTPRTSAADNNWNSVAYGNGLWVAVANNGTERLMTSPNGVTWTPRTTPGDVAENSWSSVAYGNGLWVAISSNGTKRLMTSPDGIAWTSETSAGDYAWTSVAYSDGTWVVVSSDGKVMTSVLTVLPPAIERADTVSSGTLSTLSTFGSQGSSNGQFNAPYAVATDAAGNIYAIDTNYHRVQVFTSAGIHIRSFGSQGSANGQFMYYPSGIAINAIGNIYVADTYNHRVQVFTSAGGHIRSFGSQGSANGQLIFPRGIAIDATGNIYVTDSNNHRVQVFTSAGGHIRSFGSQGSDNGQFEYPFGIAINAIGNILVSDTQNRIQVFSSIGEYISKFGTGGVTNGQFDSPRGIAIDATGNIYVADANNKRIQSFTSAGQHIRSFGTSGTGTGQFNNPFGIAIASGKIVVADTANHRIQIVGTT